jgi:hypothetical protein
MMKAIHIDKLVIEGTPEQVKAGFKKEVLGAKVVDIDEMTIRYRENGELSKPKTERA